MNRIIFIQEETVIPHNLNIVINFLLSYHDFTPQQKENIYHSSGRPVGRSVKQIEPTND